MQDAWEPGLEKKDYCGSAISEAKEKWYLIMQSDTSEIIVILIGVYEYNHSESLWVSAVQKSN